jgi:DNA-binding PadR family transcriptional regulator
MDASFRVRGSFVADKPLIMFGPGFRDKTKYGVGALDILNDVKHMEARDYFAPIVGEFEHFVLLALVRLGNGAYGATIRREIRERTGRDASVGTVYMTLGRLEKKKMVVSYVGIPTAQRGGRRRKHYLIDAEGQKALGRAYRAFARMAEGIETDLLHL